MAHVFIFHGIGGHSQENWFPWMKSKLEREGHHVLVPDFPFPDRPRLDEWVGHMRSYEGDMGKDTIFIGHSLGAAFALRLIEYSPQRILSCYLVAPVWGVMGNAFDALMTTFTSAQYDWDIIRKKCSEFTILQSDNDPYIAVEKTEALAAHLHSSVTMVEGAGHFNAVAGYERFPMLRDLIVRES